MGESRFGTKLIDAQRRVPGEAAKADHDPSVEQLELAGSVGEAGITLGRGRFVLRRGAADGRRDPKAFKTEAISAVARDGLVGKSCAVEGGEEKVTRAVAGKEAAGPVGAVGGGGKAEDDCPCCRVAEAGDGTAPVGLARVGGFLLVGDLLAPGDEPRASPTRDDLALERDQLLLL